VPKNQGNLSLADGPRDILGLAIKTAKDGAEEGGGELDLQDVL